MWWLRECGLLFYFSFFNSSPLFYPKDTGQLLLLLCRRLSLANIDVPAFASLQENCQVCRGLLTIPSR